MKITLFAKEGKPGVKEVAGYLKARSGNFAAYFGERGDKFPKGPRQTGPRDILVSYLSPWIIPGKILDKTKLWNINFHPAPPEYPGIGCFNFAIYNREKSYGVTAHLMAEKVDTVIISGTVTQICVEETAREAFHWGLKTVVLSDCVSSFDPELHHATLKNLAMKFGRVMTSDEFVADVT